jgi:protein SCO1/2
VVRRRIEAAARARGVDHAGWSFLAADAPTLDRLVEAVGFTFYPSAGGFEHMAMVSVIDREGRLHTQVYGGSFKPPAVVEPLKDLVLGRERPVLSVAGLIDRVKLICTLYDPVTGRYYFNYSLFLGIAIGAACLLLVGECRRTLRLDAGARIESRGRSLIAAADGPGGSRRWEGPSTSRACCRGSSECRGPARGWRAA